MLNIDCFRSRDIQDPPGCVHWWREGGTLAENKGKEDRLNIAPHEKAKALKKQFKSATKGDDGKNSGPAAVECYRSRTVQQHQPGCLRCWRDSSPGGIDNSLEEGVRQDRVGEHFQGAPARPLALLVQPGESAGRLKCRKDGQGRQAQRHVQPVTAAPAKGARPPQAVLADAGLREHRATVGVSPHFHHQQHIHWSSRMGFPFSRNAPPCYEKHDITSLITPPSSLPWIQQKQALPKRSGGGTVRVALPRPLQMVAPRTGAPQAPGNPEAVGVAGKAGPGPAVESGKPAVPSSASLMKQPSRKTGSRRGRSPTKRSGRPSVKKKFSSRKLSKSLSKRSRSPKHVHHFHGTKHDKHGMFRKKDTGDFTIEEAVTEMLNTDEPDGDGSEEDVKKDSGEASSHGSHEYETQIVKELRCRYHKYGCDYVKNAWEHENECQFRPVPCPDLKCWEKVAFCKLLDHIREKHPYALWIGEIPENYVSREYWNIKTSTNFSETRNTWVLTIMKSDDQHFISVFTRVHAKWYSWVYIVSHMMDARMYEYTVRIVNPERMSANSYQGLVHPVDETSNDIINSHNCFVTTDETVKHYMTKDSMPEERIKEGYDYRLPIEYKITKIRDEPLGERKDDKPEPGILSGLFG